MGCDDFHEFKRQASLFFAKTIKTARLALTDVTPAELMTEEFTKGNQWPLDTRTLRVISHAAFEVDDYWRITEILHKRLFKFDRKKWRVSYNALILLEHLLTHGPKRVADDFQFDYNDVIKEIGSILYIDENRFNWGLRVKNLSERVLKLLESETFRKEERDRTRKLTRAIIKGFGSSSLSQRSAASSVDDSSSKTHNYKDINSIPKKPAKNSHSWLGIGGRNAKQVHPFCDNEHQLGTALLLSTR